MPRLKNQYFGNSITVLRWKLTESWQELLGHCMAKRMKIDSGSLPKTDKRRCEMLAERLLLSECFMSPSAVLEHDPHGAPRIALHDDVHVSISHTRGMVLIALSEHEPMGIDVECISERVVKLREKFVNDNETAELSLVDATDLTLVWTAKEAMYKLAGVPGASLRDDFTIRSMVLTKASDTLSLWGLSTAAGERHDVQILSTIDRREAIVTTLAVYAHTTAERLGWGYSFCHEEDDASQ
ncbi:MAG: 4'-phosphopantetheinyl transferase superfamily protein [Bacteroidales bacterium]|nr:4'-phosphopantetheinyl transferase superfamily protein [Bacteroidales bacterium]